MKIFRMRGICAALLVKMKSVKAPNSSFSASLCKNLVNWLAPKTCQLCDSKLVLSETICCESCYPKLPFQYHCCTRCGQALSPSTDLCGRCLRKPPPFDACFCAFRYEEPINLLIRKYKYAEHPELGKDLAKLLYREIVENQLDLPELLVPVPLHKSRLRSRGFNQSLILARELSTLLNLPYCNKTIEKHRPTEAQATKTLKARQSNVRGSFRMRSLPDAKSIAIIDDVYTTGATAAEMTKILKRNGVDYVQVWGLAHTN